MMILIIFYSICRVVLEYSLPHFKALKVMFMIELLSRCENIVKPVNPQARTRTRKCISFAQEIPSQKNQNDIPQQSRVCIIDWIIRIL